MKHQLLFVQGGGPGVHDEWNSKLVESLQGKLGPDYEIRYPRMPHEDDPDYARWKPTLEKEIQTLPEGAILVGHSVGGTLLVKLLTEQDSAQKFGGIFLLAAPFVGEGGWPNDEWQFSADLGVQLPQDVPIYFYHGLADEEVPPAHVDLYARAVPQAHIHRQPGHNHQFNNDLKDVASTILAL